MKAQSPKEMKKLPLMKAEKFKPMKKIAEVKSFKNKREAQMRAVSDKLRDSKKDSKGTKETKKTPYKVKAEEGVIYKSGFDASGERIDFTNPNTKKGYLTSID
jgi:hypothetical protein